MLHQDALPQIAGEEALLGGHLERWGVEYDSANVTADGEQQRLTWRDLCAVGGLASVSTEILDGSHRNRPASLSVLLVVEGLLVDDDIDGGRHTGVARPIDTSPQERSRASARR